MKYSLLAAFFLLTSLCTSQEKKWNSEVLDINEYVKGTLVTPSGEEKVPLVVMLQGSGPTDRDGNQAFMKNDALKKLAAALGERGIASYRFDKRILQMQRLGIKEQDMKFDHFVADAVSVVDHFKKNPRFSKIIVLGHSQGSLVGMIAAKDNADGFISLAGVAQPIDSILIQQIAEQIPGLKENAKQAFAEMRTSGSSSSYNPVLESIFRPSVQSFILSWMKYNPQEEIANLEIPVLIINGDKDLQVNQTEAELLQTAYPEARLVILENMNHVLRKIEGDELVNSKSYNEPGLPLHPELLDLLVGFIENL